MPIKCSECGASSSLLTRNSFTEIQGKQHCKDCTTKYLRHAMSSVTITSTNNIDGYIVEEYIDFGTAEVVVGTGMFSEFEGDISDFFGKRSSGFEKKLQKAKKTALIKLKLDAYESGANAILGLDLDYTEFSGNRTGVVVNGTFVRLRPLEK